MGAEGRPRIPRLPLSEVTKAAIGMSKRGKRRSAETRAKISATLRGRKQSEGTRKALEEWQAKGCPRRSRTGESRQKKHRNRSAIVHRRLAQWVMDCRAADELGDGRLLLDVLKSEGHAERRRVHDPSGKVSSGYYVAQDRVVWLHRKVDKSSNK